MMTLIALLCFSLASTHARSKADPQVSVDAPYIEMHTGPGRGYPVFNVLERNEVARVLKRRTDWFKIETKKGQRGWVSRAQMEHTLDASGEPFVTPEPEFGDYATRRWELGVTVGEYEGADSLSLIGGLRLTANLSTELNLTQITGSFSDSKLLSLNIVHQLFPNWRATPYFLLGAGVIRTEPSATIVSTEDRTDNTLQAGLGARIYITRRFLARIEYRSHVILTSRDENEEANEWKVGFSVFF
jgi:opacity protein-like surface antigen